MYFAIHPESILILEGSVVIELWLVCVLMEKKDDG